MSSGLQIRIVTHNIRYATTSPSEGEEPWSKRCPRILAQLRYTTRYAPTTLIGLQEVLHGQLVDILIGLNADDDVWRSIGVGRNDGKQDGEYSPILYRSSAWELERQETFWLSETPDRPSKGWDASSIRLATVGVFSDRQSRQKLLVINTHLDDQGSIARRHGAELILKRIEACVCEEESNTPLPVVLSGDMNSTEDQEAYKVLAAADSMVADMKYKVNQDLRHGWDATWTGFDGDGGGEGLKRIDFVFCGPCDSSQWHYRGYSVLSNCFEDAVYLSDHRAVVADLEWLPRA